MAAWSDRGLCASLLPAILSVPLWGAPSWAGAGPDETGGPQSSAERVVRPYSARYALYRNGKLSGKLDVTLRREGPGWVLSSEGKGTHGLARILAARDNEKVTGNLQMGHFRPQQYTRHTRMATLDDHWSFEFDWSGRQVSIVHDRGDPLVLEMAGDPLDPLSLKLEMRQRLQEVQPLLRFQMVEEDEIGEQTFRLLPGEWMETSLGCLATTPVERVRQNSTRYTRAWHAPDLDNIEVRMEHGKIGGNHFELRITELSIEGVEVRPRAGCAALQDAETAAPAEDS